MAASPLVQVRDGAGAYQPTTNGINVTPGNSVVINLVSTADVQSWLCDCLYTDDLSDAPTVTASMTIDPVAKTATLPAPVAGRKYICRSRINGGIGPDGLPKPSYTTTFAVCTLVNGKRVLATNETTESNATFGWIVDFNAQIRATSSGGGSTPTGTGLRKVVGGAENAAASLLVNADVDPAAAIAASKIAAPGASGNPLVNSASAIGAATNWTIGTGLAGGAGSFLSIGTAPNIGEIRLPNGGTIYGLGPAASNAQLLRYGNGGGYLLEIGETGLVGETRLIATSGGGGSITGYLGAGNVFSFATSGTSFAVGGVTFLNMTSAYGTIETWKPLSGSYTNSSPFKWGATSVASANAGVTLTMVQCYCPNIVFTSGATATFVATGAPAGAGVEYLVANESGQAMTFMGIAIANGATSRIAYNTTAAAWRKVS